MPYNINAVLTCPADSVPMPVKPLMLMRILYKALLLFFVKTEVRGSGAARFEVEIPMHLVNLSQVPEHVHRAYLRL